MYQDVKTILLLLLGTPAREMGRIIDAVDRLPVDIAER